MRKQCPVGEGMAKMEAAMLYGSVRDRFCRAEREGWFSPGAKTTRHPLTAAGEALEPAPNGDSLYREAAVLALMGCCSQDEDDPNQLQILITKRSTEISSHPGEYCLPGGMRDAAVDTTPVETALREAREEVGIESEAVETLCSIPPFLSGWLHTIAVTPVPALLRGDIAQLELRENREEVQATMWVPLRHFIVADYHQQIRGRWRGLPHLGSSFHLPPLAPGGPLIVVWGLTAEICTVVSSVALGELPHYPSYCEGIMSINKTHVNTSELAPTSQTHRVLQKSNL